MKKNIPNDLENFQQSQIYPFVGFSDDCRIINWVTKSLLTPVLSGGYLRTNVKFNGKNRSIQLHRLVAERYIGLPPSEMQCLVNHIDGNKLNNNPCNLEWVTVEENNYHANKTGLRDSCKGFNHHSCSVSEDTVRKACAYMSMHLSNKEVDLLLGTPSGFSNDIRRGKRWKSIALEYDIPTKSNKSNIFYIIRLDNDYLKFGVTNNLDRRLIETRFRSKPFKTELVYSLKLNHCLSGKSVENLIKSSKHIPTEVLSKQQLPFGFSETAYASSLVDIIEIVNKYKPT